MQERLSQNIGSWWVKDINEGRLLRPATDEDMNNLRPETDEEFWTSADALTKRIFDQFHKDQQ